MILLPLESHGQGTPGALVTWGFQDPEQEAVGMKEAPKPQGASGSRRKRAFLSPRARRAPRLGVRPYPALPGPRGHQTQLCCHKEGPRDALAPGMAFSYSCPFIRTLSSSVSSGKPYLILR